MTDPQASVPPPAMTPAPMPAKKGGPGMIVIGCLAAVGVAAVLFIGFIVVVFGAVMGATAAPVAAADAFLSTAASRGPAAAYEQTSSAFKASATEPQFEAVSTTLQLSLVDKADWSSRNIANDTASLSGTLHYKGGVDKPISINLQKEGADWKVSNLDVRPSGN